MEKVISGIIYSDSVKILAEVLEEHPESSIICRSQSSCGNLRPLILVCSLSQLLIDIGISVPCF
jgi:hypothetical protein